ncbi:type IV secretion system protein VirB10 [Roseateles sp.]|uniref:type IV secretion system protein VirB10 n=1 Tax=Roseateles sp. TaxID=1971397 RepID=UPI002E07A42A|nr:type IV secretion system protein VirB10 [Roseateles sp.]
MTDTVQPDTPAPSEGTDSGGAAPEASPTRGKRRFPSIETLWRSACSWCWKRWLTVSIVAVIAFSVGIYAVFGAVGRWSRSGSDETRPGRNRPLAASMEPHRLDMARPAAPPASGIGEPRVPAIGMMDEGEAEPIGVRRSGTGSSVATGPAAPRPEDAPVLLVATRPTQGLAPHPSITPQDAGLGQARTPPIDADPSDPMAATTRNLQAYQRQLAGLLEKLTQSAQLAGPLGGEVPSSTADAGLRRYGVPADNPVSALKASATPRVVAGLLGNRSLTLAKGTAFTCALKTRVISATSGLVGCQVQRHVFSDDGRVLLIERGSHLDGEYRVTGLRPGSVRIPVLWTRIRTPHGVTVDIDSPATGKLGESGIEGHVDNRWTERIGAAMLLSLIDDSVKLVIENQSRDRQADTIVLPSTTANTSKLAEKVLDSTINIPPLIYQNQGGIVGIYVARDIDFSAIYALVPETDADARESR